jgi:uncharacterized protein
MIPARVSLITIGARDLPALRAFYQRLGWAESDFSSDSYAVFKTAGVHLSLFPMEELIKDSGLKSVEEVSGFKGITLAINVEQPEQVDSLITEVRKVGGRITREPSEAFWGGRTAYFLDPEDNAWEVAWIPSAVFDERGAMISF